MHIGALHTTPERPRRSQTAIERIEKGALKDIDVRTVNIGPAPG